MSTAIAVRQGLKEKLIEYFISGCKEKTRGTLGLELEHFLVDSNDLSSLSYAGSRSVESVLEQISHYYEDCLYSEGHLVGLKRNKCLITLEPAAQIEASIGEFSRIRDFEREYYSFYTQLKPVLDTLNVRLINVGYQPKSKANSLNLIPKERYALMDKHFRTSGTMGINMMRGTASTQASIDYFDENDFNIKFFVSNALTPFFAYLFDNTPIFEGKKSDALKRVKVWQNVDNQRSGFPLCAFNLSGFSDYADYILSTPPIMRIDNSTIVPTGNKTAYQVYENSDINKNEIEHILSMVFPYVRLKTYIEIRMPDSLPIKYALGFLALIKGIFYNENALNSLFEILKGTKKDDAEKAFETLKAEQELYSYKFTSFFDIVFDLAYNSLDEEERKYLMVLKELQEGIRPLNLEQI